MKSELMYAASIILMGYVVLVPAVEGRQVITSHRYPMDLTHCEFSSCRVTDY